MTRRIFSRAICLPGVLALLVLTGGCGSDDGDGSGNKARPWLKMTLEEACAAACDAQAATNCAGVLLPARCTESCIGIPEFMPNCAEAWKNLNGCMSQAPLTCDTVNGGAAVSDVHCGPEMDAFDACS
jgi:hypothetical protein